MPPMSLTVTTGRLKQQPQSFKVFHQVRPKQANNRETRCSPRLFQLERRLAGIPCHTAMANNRKPATTSSPNNCGAFRAAACPHSRRHSQGNIVSAALSGNQFAPPHRTGRHPNTIHGWQGNTIGCPRHPVIHNAIPRRRRRTLHAVPIQQGRLFAISTSCPSTAVIASIIRISSLISTRVTSK